MLGPNKAMNTRGQELFGALLEVGYHNYLQFNDTQIYIFNDNVSFDYGFVNPTASLTSILRYKQAMKF